MLSINPFNGFYEGKTVLLTGHTGFKGTWLALWLRQLGARVVGYSLPAPSDPSHFVACDVARKIIHVEGDVRDFSHLADTCEKYQPDVVFHLAAQALVRPAYEDPLGTFATNVMGTVNLLEAARRVPSVKSCVIVTSDKVYLNVGWEWAYRESDRLGGHEAYSTSKACAEMVTAVYQDLKFQRHATPPSSMAIASARAGNAVGGGDWATARIIPDIIRAITNGTELTIRHPEATRPWQHALEALSGYLQLGWLLAEAPNQYAGGWNFGPRDERMLTVAEVMRDILARWPASDVPIHIVPDESGRESLILGVDCSKARRRLGWHAAWSVRETLQATIDWYRAFYAGEDMNGVTAGQIAQFTADAAAQELWWALGRAPQPDLTIKLTTDHYPAVFHLPAPENGIGNFAVTDHISTRSPPPAAPESARPLPADWLEGFDIVALIHTEWMSVRTVPEHTMTRLAQKNRVLIVEPFNSWPTLLREARMQNRGRKARHGVRQVSDSLFVYTPAPLGVPFHTRADWVTHVNNALLARSLQRVMRKLHFSNPILWTYLFNVAGVLRRVRSQLTIYDSIDNDAALARNDAHKRRVSRHDAATCRAADLVFGCAAKLVEDRRPFNANITEVNCATDPALFAPALMPLAMPDDLRSIKGPVIGYIGGVDEVKLDVPMIRRMAQLRPDWSFVFVGFIWFGFNREVLADLTNVHFLGSKPAEQIPSYLHHMNVCIAPFALNDTTLYGDSLKVYEYLSAGRPVVSTQIPSALRVGPPVRLAATPEDFITQIAAALDETDAYIPARLAAVQSFTWDHRVAEKSRVIRAAIHRKQLHSTPRTQGGAA